jgi:hypothetical protein
MQTTTIQPEKIEGTPDRPRSGTQQPNATSIRPAIIGAGNAGFYGDETGVLRASATDPNQYAYVASQLRRGGITDFTKNVMLAGMYGEIGQGFGNPENQKAADDVFKAANLLMTEDSQAGEEMRKAYAITLWNILNKTADFELSMNETDFAREMEAAYDSGNASSLIAKIEADRDRIAGRASGRKIFQTINNAPYPGYFKSGAPGSRSPQDTYLFQSALNRVKSAASAFGKAKRLNDPGYDLGIKDIDTQQYVFFASPWDTARRSLLAIPSIDSGSGNTAAVLTAAQADKVETDKVLPGTGPYDIPATYAQLNSGSIFGTLNEAISRAIPSSSNPEIKDVLNQISKRQSANHQKDMSAAQARRARNETNTTLDQNGKDIGRRWVIEGALMWNIMHPTRNLQFIP